MWASSTSAPFPTPVPVVYPHPIDLPFGPQCLLLIIFQLLRHCFEHRPAAECVRPLWTVMQQPVFLSAYVQTN